MIPVIFKRIEIREPKWDNNSNKSITNNQRYRKCLFIIFEDYNGNEYDYMPKWDEIDEFSKKKKEIDELNKSLLKFCFEDD
jgi:hypothetical protein